MPDKELLNYFIKLSASLILQDTFPSEIINEVGPTYLSNTKMLGEYRVDKNSKDRHALLQIPTNFYSSVRSVVGNEQKLDKKKGRTVPAL